MKVCNLSNVIKDINKREVILYNCNSESELIMFEGLFKFIPSIYRDTEILSICLIDDTDLFKTIYEKGNHVINIDLSNNNYKNLIININTSIQEKGVIKIKSNNNFKYKYEDEEDADRLNFISIINTY